MPIPARDRPLDQLREEVIEQLVLNYGHDKLSREALERRLDQANDAADHDTLLTLVQDLETLQDAQYDACRDHLLYVPEDRAEKSDTIFNILSGTHRNNEEVVPETLRLINIMGGCELDFSLARFSAPVTHIKTLSIMGGAQIYVPEGVRVKSQVIPLLGGTENKSESGNDPDAPLVIVSGLALMGGLSIGVKRTFRERMQNFADEIKQMLG